MISKLSSDWRELTQAVHEEIETRRLELEQPNDPISTDLLRGRILALRWVLTLADPPPSPSQQIDTNYLP